MTVAALLVGTVLPVSGVVLAVPVIAAIAVVVWRSPWRVGDMAALVLVAGAGTALGYLLAATLDPDTGSYADQGALLLALAGVLATLTAIASGVGRLRARSAQR
jgi:prepilin signal peptidase PulO-like enzyme (type II secretory pathway)